MQRQKLTKAAVRGIGLVGATAVLSVGLAGTCVAATTVASPVQAPSPGAVSQPVPVRDANGLLLPGAGPGGSDIYLSDAHPDAVYSDPQLDPVTNASGGSVTPFDNGGGTHTERVVCQKTGYYRNYNPNTDHFADLVQYYYRGDSIRTRDAPYRNRGPRGVVVYVNNSWGS